MSNCLNCNTKLKSTQVKYCCLKCQQEYQYKQYILRWKAGKETGKKGEYQMSGHVRRYLLEKYNNKCCLCGWSEVNKFSGTIPLEIDHIDGNYNNNSEANLRLLCPNCHSLTQTYKGANKGKGRKERAKYSY